MMGLERRFEEHESVQSNQVPASDHRVLATQHDLVVMQKGRRLMATPTLVREEPDFSIVLGGPLYQILRRARLTGPALEQMHRRVLAAALITWVPLALLALIEG